MKPVSTLLAILCLATSGIAQAEETSEVRQLTDTEIQMLIDEIPDLTLMATIFMSGADRLSSSIEKSESADDNCDIVQDGYKTIFNTIRDKDVEFSKKPSVDINAEAVMMIREMLKDDKMRAKVIKRMQKKKKS